MDTFNVNANVWVRLTDRGRQELRNQFDELNQQVAGKLGAYREPDNQDGWVRFQLWDLMSTLGPLMHMGCELPIDTNIRFTEPDAALPAPNPADVP